VNKTIVASSVIILLVVGGFLLIKPSSDRESGGTLSVIDSSEAVITGETKEFRIRAFQFEYSPSTLEVNQGDRVVITAYSSDVPHGLSIPGYGVNLYLDGQNEKTAEFVADKKGTFEFYCSVVCGSGHGTMRGQLIVV